MEDREPVNKTEWEKLTMLAYDECIYRYILTEGNMLSDSFFELQNSTKQCFSS